MTGEYPHYRRLKATLASDAKCSEASRESGADSNRVNKKREESKISSETKAATFYLDWRVPVCSVDASERSNSTSLDSDPMLLQTLPSG